MRKLRLALLIVVVILVLLIGGFVVWASTPPAPMPAAIAALESNERVTVQSGDWITFVPAQTTPTTGFIFYPGGRVDARSYAPPLRAIAEAGYLVVLVPVPLNLAFFGIENANAVIAAYPEIERWVIGGHSLGGAMAGRYTHDHPDTIDGLVLWASFVEESFTLSARDLPVASIYGTLDGLASVESVEASRAALPADAQLVAIEGGNHAQFGDYGDQAGDRPATISREVQQAQAVAATVALLQLASEG
ncbi:MAG: alpha/beta hydrolase [Chloroflexota bacterium]|nr:alpha/beta hydrolase [Chloroflexota bacterium]